MSRENIEELSNPLLVKNTTSKLHSGGSGSSGSNNNGGASYEEGGESSSSATIMVVVSTLVAVSGSYVFGSAAELERLLVGCGMGLLSHVVPIYIAEITPKNLQGGFTTVHQAKIGKWKECEATLQRLRRENSSTSQEVAEIRDYTETLKRLSKARILDLFQRRYAYSLAVRVGLMVLQQFGGVNGIAFYASTIFISAGFSDSVGTIAMVAVQVPMTAFGVILMDKAGRRPLLLVSSAGTCLGCLLVGLSFSLQNLQQWKQITPILIFPINMKGSAGSLITLVSWLGSWIVSYAFNFLMDWSSAGTFFLFSSVSAVTVLFVAKLVPETKGRTLEEIQTSLNRFSEK
ncbi:hypothetical protein C1H46_028245 [Malus baccata]|uniref:Major facilitator superfamily (MFS) profile domain-containing protein n=1 Tax=Malus baccata TaxID=106549 RepID=A0A540LIC5_MALBA|nr:hypothetical protein C1H46_028245 [Malus baccata]